MNLKWNQNIFLSLLFKLKKFRSSEIFNFIFKNQNEIKGEGAVVGGWLRSVWWVDGKDHWKIHNWLHNNSLTHQWLVQIMFQGQSQNKSVGNIIHFDRVDGRGCGLRWYKEIQKSYQV